MPLSPELAELNRMMQAELGHSRARFGDHAIKMRHEQVGRSTAAGFWRDEVDSDLAPW